MRYVSTRGQAPVLEFEEVLLAGLASDGGLYVPEILPVWDGDFLKKLRDASYEEICYQVIAPFVGDAFSEGELRMMIDQTYAPFAHICRAPLLQIGDQEMLLELHRGPTLAFKDFAMQLIGNLFSAVLERRNRKLTIIGATSGDTGSAAIEAFKNKPNVNVFILFPKGRVSNVQQRQMTTSGAANVYPIAIEGDFDDCQKLVKDSFANQEFRDEIALGGVNSINWGRVMAQIVYYVSAAISLGAPERAVSFVVPTGNFGDIYAGYLAKKMGLPVNDLVIATNRNDILYRTVETGKHEKTGVHATMSPSIDIQVSSNFERLLFDLYDRDSQQLISLMNALEFEGRFELSDVANQKLRASFKASRADEAQTAAMIKEVYEQTGELICPHTAVAVHGARHVEIASPRVILATAHAAKFPDAVEEATGVRPSLPPFLADLMDKQEVFDVMPKDFASLMAYVREKLK